MRSFLPTIRRLWHERSGAALVELAIIAPVLATMVLGMVDVSLWVAARMSVERAARAGAEYAVLHPGNYSSSSITSAATSGTASRRYMSAVTATPAAWYGCPNATTGITTATSSTATCASGLTAGTYVTVTTRSTYSFPLPWREHGSSTVINGTSTVRTN